MFEYFTDPVLRGPTIGSMLMCLSASLIGVIVFLRKQSLIGEALSHAAYPGVILGVIVAGFFSITELEETTLSLLIMIGAYLLTLLGFLCIHFLEHRMRIRSDSALCFVLSTFFGIGITLASQVQFSFTSLYRQAQTYLYGQAATMTDSDILIYGILTFLVVGTIKLFDKEIETITFNREYASTLGINIFAINSIIYLLIALSIVIGMRSVGVVLMSAMFIIPAASARQFTNRFSHMLQLAAIFGLLSGFLGNLFSVEISKSLTANSQMRISLPTGPTIVVVSAIICVFSLLFAPERGLLLRFLRIARFRYLCLRENLLKAFWKEGANQTITFEKIRSYQHISSPYLSFILYRLTKNGWIQKSSDNSYRLTQDGFKQAQHIVRLHRLWEVYLAEYLEVGNEKVHRSAEEMEHILTPELEQELTILLNNPKIDPHHQKIPSKEDMNEPL